MFMAKDVGTTRISFLAELPQHGVEDLSPQFPHPLRGFRYPERFMHGRS